MNPWYFHSSLSKMPTAKKQKQLWEAKFIFFFQNTFWCLILRSCYLSYSYRSFILYTKWTAIFYSWSQAPSIMWYIFYAHTVTFIMNLIDIHADDITSNSSEDGIKPGTMVSQMSLRRETIQNKQHCEITVYYWALLQDQSV